MLGRDPYPAVRRRGLFGRGKGPTTATLAEVARRELADPRLVALLESHALAYGFDPRSAPASAAVLPYMEQTFGSWYPRGGMRALADALYERCLARKVEFGFGAEVTRIVEKDGRATGVELADGRVSEAEFVVAGVASGAAGGALPAGGRGVRTMSRPEPGPRGPRAGRLTVCSRAARRRGPRTPCTGRSCMPRTARRSWRRVRRRRRAGPPGPRPTVTVLRPDDPATRPDDAHEAVTLTATVAPRTARSTGTTARPRRAMRSG